MMRKIQVANKSDKADWADTERGLGNTLKAVHHFLRRTSPLSKSEQMMEQLQMEKDFLIKLKLVFSIAVQTLALNIWTCLGFWLFHVPHLTFMTAGKFLPCMLEFEKKRSWTLSVLVFHHNTTALPSTSSVWGLSCSWSPWSPAVDETKTSEVQHKVEKHRTLLPVYILIYTWSAGEDSLK